MQRRESLIDRGELEIVSPAAGTRGGIPLRKYQFARLVFYAPLLRVKGLRVLGDDAIRGTGFWENKTDEHT